VKIKKLLCYFIGHNFTDEMKTDKGWIDCCVRCGKIDPIDDEEYDDGYDVDEIKLKPLTDWANFKLPRWDTSVYRRTGCAMEIKIGRSKLRPHVGTPSTDPEDYISEGYEVDYEAIVGNLGVMTEDIVSICPLTNLTVYTRMVKINFPIVGWSDNTQVTKDQEEIKKSKSNFQNPS